MLHNYIVSVIVLEFEGLLIVYVSTPVKELQATKFKYLV